MSESGAPGAPGGMTAAVAFAGMRRVSPVVFKAGCPDCRGRFELAASALRLAIGATSRTTFYSFTCPECGSAVRKPAGSGSWSCSPAAGSGPSGCTPPSRLGVMFWPMFAVAVGFLGLAVLAVLAVKVFVEAQRLGRQVTESARRINRAAEDLERATESAARAVDAL